MYLLSLLGLLEMTDVRRKAAEEQVLPHFELNPS